MTPHDTARAIVERIAEDIDGAARAERLSWSGQERAFLVKEWVALVVPVVEELVDRVTCAESNAADCHVFCHESDARAEAAEKERDAYKRAKAENDERFMIERDEARAERDELRLKLAEAEAAALGGQRLVDELRAEVDSMRRERNDALVTEQLVLEGQFANPAQQAKEIEALKAKVERLTLACANAVPMSALQAEEAESERLSRRVEELEAALSELIQSVGIPASEEWLSQHAYRRAMGAYSAALALLSPPPAAQPCEACNGTRTITVTEGVGGPAIATSPCPCCAPQPSEPAPPTTTETYCRVNVPCTCPHWAHCGRDHDEECGRILPCPAHPVTETEK